MHIYFVGDIMQLVLGQPWDTLIVQFAASEQSGTYQTSNT